jgi:hypothetical protein
MGILKKKKLRRRRLRLHGALRCALNGHQVSWCRGLCEPIAGRGLCGREAPHTLRGKTQIAIERYNARLAEGTS